MSRLLTKGAFWQKSAMRLSAAGRDCGHAGKTASGQNVQSEFQEDAPALRTRMNRKRIPERGRNRCLAEKSPRPVSTGPATHFLLDEVPPLSERCHDHREFVGDPGNFDDWRGGKGACAERSRKRCVTAVPSRPSSVDSGSNRPGGASGTLEAVRVDSGRTSKIHERCKVSPLEKISRGLWAHTL